MELTKSMKRHSTSSPCGNLVDGLPHDCHMETVAKPGRIGPVQNYEPMQNLFELTMFFSIIDKKAPGISCPECIEDLDTPLKM